MQASTEFLSLQITSRYKIDRLDEIRSVRRSVNTYRHIGAVWQFADSTDILSHSERCRKLATIALEDSIT